MKVVIEIPDSDELTDLCIQGYRGRHPVRVGHIYFDGHREYLMQTRDDDFNMRVYVMENEVTE